MWIVNRRIFIRGTCAILQAIRLVTYSCTLTEASSRIYSPYVFALGQLVGEIPYSVLCAVVYWLLMVRSLVSVVWNSRLTSF